MTFETRVAELMGGVQRPGSGNQWYAKGDVESPFLVSCKAEKDRSWAATRRQLRDAIDDAVGSGRLPLLALLEPDGEELAVVRLSDLLEALSAEDTVFMSPESSGERRRRVADTPALLRDAD